MLVLIGALIVLLSTIGGFVMAGGNPLVLLHVSEFVVILGIALGVLIIATPLHVIKEIIHKTKDALAGKTAGKKEFFDMLKLLYELFMTGRRNGLKPVIDGKIKPDQLEDLMAAELHAKEVEMDHPVHAMQMIGDSLPAIGIVAAVLGIINTMSAIAEGPEVVGEKVAAALTGTLLGIFVAYGFVNPLAGRIRSNNASEMLCLNCIMHAVAGFAKGLAPLTAVEVARRSLDGSVQPGAEELEAAVKGLGTGK